MADGLRCPVGSLAWEIIQQLGYVEGLYSVSEEDIRQAMVTILKNEGLVVEPSAAVALAVALLSDSFKKYVAMQERHFRVGIILTGGNIELEDFSIFL